MTTRSAARLSTLFLLAGLPLLAVGCAANRGAPEAAADGAAPDTLSGTVALVGADPMSWVVIRPGEGQGEVRLLGDAVVDLRRVAGVDVQVMGRVDRGEWADRMGIEAFVVESFAVRAVEGIPAVDGVLVFRDGGANLRLQGGELVPVRNLPAALREHEGARVWLAGELDGDIVAFGVISSR